ncbi:hypothetical protein QR680_014536 [Steinernema hermaphroditum]|uniref:Peptidase M13 N-terminal domain-containing protein n=1 Tax=Steinernema hermaphroditum TaxID=289476 RepID=A0AA39M427_9BILA|nr:hypothetical protein QR680_014536 [Steinernema hermaphroditum]
MRLLVVSVLCLASISQCQQEHKFSSSVGPCDDFHEFVCNKDGNNGQSQLQQELRYGYKRTLNDCLLNYNDTILDFFDTLPGFDRAEAMKTRIIWEYYNLIYAKCIVNKNIIPFNTRNIELPETFEKVKQRVIEIIENSTSITDQQKKDITAELKAKKAILGLPLQVNFHDLLDQVTDFTQQFFDDLKKSTPLPSDCDANCTVSHYAKLLDKAYAMTNADKYITIRFTSGNETITIDLTRPYILTNSTYIYKNQANVAYFSPATLYVPSGRYSEAMKHVDKISFAFLFLQDAFKKLGNSLNNEAIDCYRSKNISDIDLVSIESFRIVADMLLEDENFADNPMKFGDVMDSYDTVQRFAIGMELYWCRNDSHSGNTYKYTQQFQDSFECKADQKMFSSQEDMCRLFY